MIFQTDPTKPIYIQIAEWLENEILNDHPKSDGKIYSQYQLAEMFNINPATAAKGLTILADEEILYKKRGLGMFVSMDAKEKIFAKRKERTLKKLVQDLVLESTRLKVDQEELFQLIRAEIKRQGEE